jgi:hypothetical protein
LKSNIARKPPPNYLNKVLNKINGKGMKRKNIPISETISGGFGRPLKKEMMYFVVALS